MFVIYPDICNLGIVFLLLQINIVNSDQSLKLSILEKFSASFLFAVCVIPDESILKQLEVISKLKLFIVFNSFFISLIWFCFIW